MSSQFEENLYPRSSQFYSPNEPKEQKEERDKEKEAVLASEPIIKAVIERLQGRIEFYSSVDSVPKELIGSPTDFMHQIAINKGMKAELLAEKEGLENMLTDYK